MVLQRKRKKIDERGVKSIELSTAEEEEKKCIYIYIFVEFPLLNYS